MARENDQDEGPDIDPREFLSALLRISKEDAAEVRKVAAERTAKGRKKAATKDRQQPNN